MKKNITVNLFGTLYAIDDDACKLLEQYLDIRLLQLLMPLLPHTKAAASSIATLKINS